jgi:hypothetical protein
MAQLTRQLDKMVGGFSLFGASGAFHIPTSRARP